MARQKEATFRANAMKKLHALPHSHWFRIEQQSLRGTPDTLGVIRSLAIAIEFKSTKKAKATDLQLYSLGKWAKAGGISILAHPENFEEILSELVQFAHTGEGEIESMDFSH